MKRFSSPLSHSRASPRFDSRRNLLINSLCLFRSNSDTLRFRYVPLGFGATDSSFRFQKRNFHVSVLKVRPDFQVTSEGFNRRRSSAEFDLAAFLEQGYCRLFHSQAAVGAGSSAVLGRRFMRKINLNGISVLTIQSM